MGCTAVIALFKDAPESVADFRWVAEACNSARIYLAYGLFLERLGGDERLAEAARYFEKASDMGDADATAKLGDCLFYG